MTEEAAKPTAGRLGKIIRALAAVGLLVIVLTRVPLDDLVSRFKNIRVVDVLPLFVLAGLQMTVATSRWWRLLRRLGETVPFTGILRDVLVGGLFNTFLPTNVGGDVVRALRASRRLERGSRAWSTSFFERLVGMLTLAMVGASATVFALGAVLPAKARVVVIVLTLTLGVLFFFVSKPIKLLVGLLEKRLPESFIADVRGVVEDLEVPLARTGPRIETFGWSLLGYVVGVVYLHLGAIALGAPGHLIAIMLGLPIVSVLSFAPISLGGHGLREGLFVVVLGALSVPRDVAFGLALLALAYNIVFALLGGVAALVEPTPTRS